jgi:hypothetical protein
MPDSATIQRSLTGAWRLMMGRPEGIKLLDISAEGFWDSFFAVVIAAPALALGWIASSNEMMLLNMDGSRLSILGRLAFIDLAVWTLPLVALGLVARQAGIGDRFVHYVVSSNWASALLIWMMVPPSILRLMAPDAGDVASILSLIFFLGSLVLSWRQTNAALNKGAAVATAVFVGMFLCSLAVLIALQTALALNMPDQVPG